MRRLEQDNIELSRQTSLTMVAAFASKAGVFSRVGTNHLDAVAAPPASGDSRRQVRLSLHKVRFTSAVHLWYSYCRMHFVSARVRPVIPLTMLVALDAFIKIAAYLFIKPHQIIGSSTNLQLMLRVNRTGVGSWGQSLYSGASALVYWRGAFAALAVAATLVAVRQTRRGALFVVFACFGASVAGSFGADLLSAPLGELSDSIAVTCMRGTQAAFWITAWSLTKSRPWKLGFLLVSASAVGNFLSRLYPPFSVVDYLYSAPLSRVTHMGVINLADAMFLLALPILTFSAVRSLWGHAQLRHSRNNSDENSSASDGEPVDDSAKPTLR